MWDFLKHLKEILSLDYRSLFILACVGWVIILIPISIWQEMGLMDLWYLLRPWIFIVALISTVWLVSKGAYDLVNTNIDRFKKRNENEKLILTLSRQEKEILASYIIEDATTLAFDIRDGVINGLIAKGILYRASQLSNPFSYDFDVNIQIWAHQYLKTHPKILQGITPNETKRHHIKF